MSASIVKDKQGNILHSISVQKDITEQKKAEEDLRNSEQRFRDLVNLLPQSVWEMDLDGNILFTNQYGFVSTGYTPDDLKKDANIEQLFKKTDREKIMGRVAIDLFKV